MTISLIELIVLGNTALLLGVAFGLNLQVRAARVTLLAHRARLEESIARLEKELGELKAGSIIALPPNHSP